MDSKEASQTKLGDGVKRSLLPKPVAKVLFLPFAFTAALAGSTFLPPVHRNPKALAAFLAATALLCVWNAVLASSARRKGRVLTLQWMPKKQHYVQACAQGSVLVYWGLYWPPVYEFAPFILAQLLFAYAFDMLLCWSRRDDCILGFAPFPVIFSINLFLWFKPDWFWLQFLMVAVGLAAKELIRWNREGRRAHIFNPSSFPLAVFSLVLLATGASGITSGTDIATTQFFPPQIYLALFLIGLPGQFFFGVTSMTMSAAVTTWLFSRIYFAATGIYFFYDSWIPVAVFLGMHLLFNDPSTSPRTELGRIVYGVLYGLSTCAIYDLLGRAGMPTFYDKLLQVPLLNLSVKVIDGAARSRFLRRLDPAALGRSFLGQSLAPLRRNLAYIGVWTVIFVALSTQGLSDNHPGQWMPFWRNACDQGRPYACPYLADLEQNACDRGSAWACNESGLLDITLSRTGEDLRRTNIGLAREPFDRGCKLGSAAACGNLGALSGTGAELTSAPPTLKDYPIILIGSKGDVRAQTPSQLFALACREGWPNTCASNNR